MGRTRLSGSSISLPACLSPFQARKRPFPERGGRLSAVRPRRLQANVGCDGEAGGERPGQVHRSVQLQQLPDRRPSLCGQHQAHRAAGAGGSYKQGLR